MTSSGRRLAWVYAPGSYAQRIAIPAASLVPVPDTIDDRSAATVMMQGLTASHFATDFYPMQPGDVLETFADIADLMRDTGFAPATPIEEGIRDFVAWYRKHYRI